MPTWGRYRGGKAFPEEECVHGEIPCNCLCHMCGEGHLPQGTREATLAQTVGDRSWMRGQARPQNTSRPLSREAGGVVSHPPPLYLPSPQRFCLTFTAAGVHMCLVSPPADSQVQPGLRTSQKRCSESRISSPLAGSRGGDLGQGGVGWVAFLGPLRKSLRMESPSLSWAHGSGWLVGFLLPSRRPPPQSYSPASSHTPWAS